MEEMIKQEEFEIDLDWLLRPVRRGIWTVIAVSVISALIYIVGTLLFSVPQYESSVLFYVGEGMADHYIVILDTRETLLEILEDSGAEQTIKTLGRMLEAEIVSTTQFLRVSVTSPDPLEAEAIASSVCRILPRRVSEIVGNVASGIADHPVTAEKPSSPNCAIRAVIGFAGGFALSCAVLILRDLGEKGKNSEPAARKR